MADVSVDLENATPKELFGQGIRAYVLQDYVTAVQALSRASELLVKEHGDELHESLGDIYLYYGKALLGLSRDEVEALGDAVPKNVEEDESEEEEEADDEKTGGEEGKVEAEAAEKSEEAVKPSESKEEKKEEQPAANGSTETDPQPSCSNSEEKTENPEEDDLSDLQVAWEILELAKQIFSKKGEDGRKNLAETLIVLGEIAMESENFDSAINDIKEGLTLQKEIFENDSRAVAETLYKLGMAYSTGSQIDDAVTSFEESLQYLKNRVEKLKKIDDEEAKEEVTDIEALIPEVEEKIADMKSYKEEAVKKITNAMKEEDNKPTSTSSSSGKANDISHLVKRKRKLDDVVEDKAAEDQQPTKKVSP